MFTHCYGHALNLGVGDTVKKANIMRDCLDTCYELIKFSPKREAMLHLIKEEVESDSPSMKFLSNQVDSPSRYNHQYSG